MTGWRVFASWTAMPDGRLWSDPETCIEYPSWPQARQEALQLSCLRGIRYVSVQRPDDVVAGEYDRITNQWRQYPYALADVDHTTEVTDEGGSAAAWCTCGWSRFKFYDRRHDGTAEAAKVRAGEFAREHEADPCAERPVVEA